MKKKAKHYLIKKHINRRITIILILLIVVFSNCKQNQTKSDSFVSETEKKQEKFPDGKYCTDINYYNPDTGKSSNYTLAVEVENGELIKLEWSNGGWLDSSHFSPPDITDGTANFEDDKGREFEVTLKEQGSCKGVVKIEEIEEEH